MSGQAAGKKALMQVGRSGWIKGRRFHVDESTCKGAKDLKARLTGLGGITEDFLANNLHVVVTRQRRADAAQEPAPRGGSAKSIGASSRARKLMAGAGSGEAGGGMTVLQDFLCKHGSKITIMDPETLVTHLDAEEEAAQSTPPPPQKRSKPGHFIEIGQGKDGRRDFGKVEPGVLPVWHISIPMPGERAAWLERERKKEKAAKTARQEKGREKKTCGFCNTVYTDWEQHVESQPHKQMILRVERNETPEAQAFRDFFGLPDDDFADIIQARSAQSTTCPGN